MSDDKKDIQRMHKEKYLDACRVVLADLAYFRTNPIPGLDSNQFEAALQLFLIIGQNDLVTEEYIRIKLSICECEVCASTLIQYLVENKLLYTETHPKTNVPVYGLNKGISNGS